jgi:uncharacterized protein
MPTPREVFAELARYWVGGTPTFPRELLADDVVVEMPLAPPGWPNRVEGRETFVPLAEAGRAALPVRFHDCRDVVLHQTTDPEVTVAEYELAGTHTTTRAATAARFIAVFRIRDGRIARWREYHNVMAQLR